MSLEQDIMSAMKDAMRSKDQVALRALRAVKSALIIQKTEVGSSSEMSDKDEMKLLQKLVKQRRDSADIFSKQNREDLAHTPTIGGSDRTSPEEENTEDQNQLLKIVKDITSKGFVRNNYKKNLVDLSDIKISLKGKK